jgi:preprotein translocase subunit SecG
LPFEAMQSSSPAVPEFRSSMAALLRFSLGFLLVFSALFLIALVLIQRGRGGGLAGAFGGMGGQSAFGTKAGDVFTKITVIVAACWILLCIFAINLLSRRESLFSPTLGGTAGQAVPSQTTIPAGSPAPDGGAAPVDGSAPAGQTSPATTPAAPAAAEGQTSPDALALPASPAVPAVPATPAVPEAPAPATTK